MTEVPLVMCARKILSELITNCILTIVTIISLATSIVTTFYLTLPHLSFCDLQLRCVKITLMILEVQTRDQSVAAF